MAETKKHHSFPPVVAVVGHVDHGKTTLLDTFRKSNIADREHGGITQKIGASSVEIEHEGEKRKITFIDTPGHEAFARMRGRGVMAADLALLVVSSVDGVMPQTVESIRLLKEAKAPFIVVLTKSDDQNKNPEKAKQQLVKEEVLLEGYGGGDVPVIEVSAKTNSNIKELLDLIIVLYDVKTDEGIYKNSPDNPLEAIVIESKLDQKAGPRATIVIKNGRLNIKDEIQSGNILGRVRTLINDKGVHLKDATVGDAVEILGFEEAPPVGSVVSQKGEAQTRDSQVDSIPIPEKDDHHLSLVLVADTQGSLEALTNSLSDEIRVVLKKTGDIEASDVLFAKSTGAVVLGFNTKASANVMKLAETEKVLVKVYTLIYEMIDEIYDFVEGKISALAEKTYGEAKILARFPFDKTEVLGIQVIDGRVAKGDRIRLVRGEEILGEANVQTVRQQKDQVSKIEKGQEGGIIISPRLDFTIGDMLISHS